MIDHSSVPFDGSPHSVSIGVRRLDLDDWLDLDDRASKVAAKLPILHDSHASAVATLDGSEAGGTEVLQLVIDHLLHRSLVRVEARRVVDEATGAEVNLDELHPLDAAARLVGEDLCLMEVTSASAPAYVLTAASVCFPSRWRLADKIGVTLRSIHDPVPGYESIAQATDRFFDAITIDRPVQRVNWTLIDDPELFQPEPARRDADHAARTTFDDPATQVHLRIERQTLRRLPVTGGVLFTIGTDVRPLAALTAAQRTDLAGSIRGVDEATSAYKGWSVLLPAVRAWLTP